MSFTCPRCGAVSHHPKDEQQGYCGRCHDFTGQPGATMLLGAVRREIEMLRQLSEIERRAGHTQSTWQLLRDIAHRLDAASDAELRIERVDQTLARQLSRSIMENVKLRQRIAELETRTDPARADRPDASGS